MKILRRKLTRKRIFRLFFHSVTTWNWISSHCRRFYFNSINDVRLFPMTVSFMIFAFALLQERGNCTMLNKTGTGQRLLHGVARWNRRSTRWEQRKLSRCFANNLWNFFVDTPYEFGTFNLEIHVPETYPFNPPKVKFLTKIWHPNISSVTGAICLDILKDNWAAAMTLRTVLLSLQALLASAEPDDPQDAVVASQYKENFEMFCRTAKHWTNSYAKGEKFWNFPPVTRSHIEHLF